MTFFLLSDSESTQVIENKGLKCKLITYASYVQIFLGKKTRKKKFFHRKKFFTSNFFWKVLVPNKH